MLEIKEYNVKYASALSRIILDNLYTINIKDHGKEVIDKLSLKFSEEEIKKTFPSRTKCFVAVEEDVVLGTASVDRLWGDDTGLKYIVLTVFVSLEAHGKGIGKKLMLSVINEAKRIGAKELHVISSIYACEFYRKLGFDYLNGVKEQNKDKEYMLVKYF